MPEPLSVEHQRQIRRDWVSAGCIALRHAFEARVSVLFAELCDGGLQDRFDHQFKIAERVLETQAARLMKTLDEDPEQTVDSNNLIKPDPRRI